MAETAGKLGHLAGVAQLVERLSCKQGVSGSSPLSGFSRIWFAERFCRPRANVVVHPECEGVNESANISMRAGMVPAQVAGKDGTTGPAAIGVGRV
jgi:hypothetical protein